MPYAMISPGLVITFIKMILHLIGSCFLKVEVLVTQLRLAIEGEMNMQTLLQASYNQECFFKDTPLACKKWAWPLSDEFALLKLRGAGSSLVMP